MKQHLMIAAAAAALTVCGAAVAAPFTGIQMGVDAGYATGKENQTRFSNPGGPYIFTQADADLDGGVYGAHIGYNWQFAPNVVGGFEGSLGSTAVSGNDGGLGGDINGFDGKWQAALMGKAGFLARPDTLLYVTAGWSWLNGDGVVLNAPTESVNETFSGLSAGAGVEYNMGSKVTIRLQYRYSDYQDKRVAYPINAYDIQTGPTLNEVTVGLSFYP